MKQQASIEATIKKFASLFFAVRFWSQHRRSILSAVSLRPSTKVVDIIQYAKQLGLNTTYIAGDFVEGTRNSYHSWEP